MKINEFSGGYYRAKMSVQPFEDGPSIEQGLYNLIEQKIYENTNAPITMRLGLNKGPRFTPSTEISMPQDVVGVPQSVLDNSDIHPSDDNVNVFILKPDAAYRFNKTMDASEQYYFNEEKEPDQ